MNQGERKPSPIGDTSSNSSEKQFSLPNKLNILIQKEAPACVECEWADRSWNILLLLRKSWLLPALPGNISGKQLSAVDVSFLTSRTTLRKLNHSKSQRQVTPYRKHIYIHALWISEDRFRWKIRNSVEKDFMVLNQTFTAQLPPKRITQSFFTALIMRHIHFPVTKIKTA